MENVERANAQREAVEAASKATESANRARLWAGLNRYLAAEADRAHKAAHDERKGEETGKADKPDKAGHRKV